MTLPFAAIARARAKMIGGRLEGEQDRYQRDAADNARLFQQWATKKQLEAAAEQNAYIRDRNTKLDAERAAERVADNIRQREQDQQRAIEQGGENAPEATTAQLLAGLSMMQGGTGAASGMVKTPRTTPYRQKVGGVDVSAEDMGGPMYNTVGGRVFRFDRQKDANAGARKRAEDASVRYQERMDALREQAANRRAMVDAARAAVGGGGAPAADNKAEMPLRKEFNQEMTRHTQIAPALAKIRESAKLQTGQGDMGIIYGFMRLQDPGSTVREGEYATAQNSAGVPEQVRQLYNKVLTGEKLAPEVRSRFVAAADQLGQTEREQARKVIERYAWLATRYGMSADAVVYDPYDAVYGMYQGAGKPGVGPDGKPFRPRRPLDQVVGGAQ